MGRAARYYNEVIANINDHTGFCLCEKICAGMKNILFPVSEGGKKFYVPAERIKYVTANGAYSTLHMLDGKQYYISWRIGLVEKYLKPGKTHFRSHESALVNTTCVNWCEPPARLTLPMIDGTHQLFAKRSKSVYKKLRAKMTAGK